MFPSSDFSPLKGYAQIRLTNEVLLTLFLKYSVDVCFPCYHPEIHSTIWILHQTADSIRTYLQGTETYLDLPLISVPQISTKNP